MAKDKILLHSVSKNKDGETFDVRWNGLLVGTVVVPYNTAAVLDFKTKSGVNTYYIQKAALKLCNEYKRDINVQMTRKSFTVNAASFEHKKTKQNNPDVEWRKYYNFINKYMGKYHEIESNKKIGIELMLKKKIEIPDAVLVISEFLKKYPFVKFTVSQMVPKPVVINDTMSKSEIDAIVAHTMTWGETKEKFYDNKHATSGTDDDADDCENIPNVDREPRHDLDPMILAKAMTLICSPKQDIEAAKKLAQQKANDQYTYVKLLDSNRRFVCNLYPTITAAQHVAKRARRIREAIYRSLEEREIGE